MITAFKALCKAVSWGLKGVLGPRQRGSFPLDWDVNRAVDGAVREAVDRAANEDVYRATDWAVRRAVYGAVWGAVRRAVNGAGYWTVSRAVDRAVWNDPEHPALADFLREASAGEGVE